MSKLFSEEERKRLSFVLFRKEPYENHRVGMVEEIACYCFKKGKDSCEYYIYGDYYDKLQMERH